MNNSKVTSLYCMYWIYGFYCEMYITQLQYCIVPLIIVWYTMKQIITGNAGNIKWTCIYILFSYSFINWSYIRMINEWKMKIKKNYFYSCNSLSREFSCGRFSCVIALQVLRWSCISRPPADSLQQYWESTDCKSQPHCRSHYG